MTSSLQVVLFAIRRSDPFTVGLVNTTSGIEGKEPRTDAHIRGGGGGGGGVQVPST